MFFGSKRALQRAHQRPSRWRFVARQLVALHHADAMLGADRAAEFVHDVMHDELHFVPAREECCIVAALWRAEIEMEIAVAEMAEADGPRAGNSAPAPRGAPSREMRESRRPAPKYRA